MMEKYIFNSEIAEESAQEEESTAAREMRTATQEDGFSATEGAFEADFETLAGFDNDLPSEIDERSANHFFGKWNIPLDDHIRDRLMD